MRLILQSLIEKPLVNLHEFRNHVLLRRRESDQYLLELLNLAVNAIEKRTDISLRQKTWRLTHNNCVVNLPKGPVREIISIHSVKNRKAVEPIDIVRNGDNIILRFEESVGLVEIIYKTGYEIENLPFCLKTSIIEMFWKLYDYNEQKLQEHYDLQDFKFHNDTLCSSFNYGGLL